MTTRKLPDVGRRTSRASLVRAGALLIGGLLLSQLATMFHPGQQDPNDHPAVFAEYAASSDWIWVHFAQWASVLVLLSGFVVLYEVIRAHRADSVLPLLALGAVGTTAAAITVNMAVDGVALKHAVDAWAGAAPAERSARFAAAETVRWLEWAANSFFAVLLGMTIALFGLIIVRDRILPGWLGWAGVLSGACLLASGVIVAYDGFTSSPLGLIASILFLVMAGGMIVAGARQRHTRTAGIDRG